MKKSLYKQLYKRFLLQGGKKPKTEKIISAIQKSYSQITFKVLAKYQEEKQILFTFDFWNLPNHNSQEIRLSSFSSNQLV